MINEITKLAQYLLKKNYVIAFTGAGISTDSGIPDFRSGNEGIWTKINPELMTARVLRSQPEIFFKNYEVVLAHLKNKQPNLGHQMIVELSRLGVVRAVVTQNIDGLHTLAGSRRVFEIHGNLLTCKCVGCKKEFSHQLLEEALAEKNYAPTSPCCKSLLRPGVTLFGDKMAPDFQAALEEAWRADFALVIGTSLSVFPAAEIPLRVGEFAVINHETTALNDKSVINIKGSASERLTELVKIIRNIK